MASAVAAQAKTACPSSGDGDLTTNTNHALNVTADTQDLRQVMAMLQDNDNADEDATVKLPTSTLLDDATIQLPSSLLPVAMSHKVALGEKEGCSPAPATEGNENVNLGNGTKSSGSKSSSGKPSSTGGERTSVDRVGETRRPLRALNVHAALAPVAPVEQPNRRQTVDAGALEDFFQELKGKETGNEGGEEENQQPASTATASVVVPKTMATMTMTSARAGTLASADGLAERRETADPESLRYLLTLLKSPGGTGPASRASLLVSPSKAIEKILGSALAAADEEAKEADGEGGERSSRATAPAIATGCSSSSMTGRDQMAAADLTADTSQLERLIVDLETSITEGAGGVTGALGEGTANFFVSPIARRRSSIMARRLTADPELLEDLINELTGGKGQRHSTTSTAAAAAMVMTTTRTTTLTTVVASSSTKSPAAAAAAVDSRRTTASPAGIGMLLADLPAEDVEEGGVNGGQGKKDRKSLRLAEQVKTPTGVPAAAGGTFSMSPPPLPPHGSSRKSLRSCLSSKKERPSRALPPASPGLGLLGSGTKKSVVFGSPNAAYFNKGSPSNSLTPMTKRDVDLIFLRGGGGGKESAESESGVTAENTAILAQWNEDSAAGNGGGMKEGDEEEEEEEIEEGAAGGSGKRKRVSKSPRPKRRQSLMLPAGSPGFMKYRGGRGGGARAEDEEDEEGVEMGGEGEVSSIGGNSLNEKLEQAKEKEQSEDTDQDCDMAMPMDVSPAPSTASSRRRRSSGASTISHEEEMPDLEDRSFSSSNFRALDQRTSSQLGIIGAAAAGGEGGVGEDTMELEQDLQSLVHNTRPQIPSAVSGAAREDRTMELEGDLQALMQRMEGGRGQQRQQAGAKKAKMDINLGDVDSDAEEHMSQLHEPTSTTTFNANARLKRRRSLDEVTATALAEAEEVSAAMPVEFNWKRVVAFQQEQGNIMRLVEVVRKEGEQDEEKEGTPVALLRQAALEALLENCESVALNQLRRGDEVDGSKATEVDRDDGKEKMGDKGVEFELLDVEALREAMLAASMLPSEAESEGEGGTEAQAGAMEQLIAAVAPRLELEWQSLESQLLQMVRMRVMQEMGTLKGRGVELAADMERVSAIEGEVQEAIGALQAKFKVLRAQRKDAARQHRLEELEDQQREASARAVALAMQEEALKAAVCREEEAAKTREAARQMIAQVRAALTEKNREVEAVQAIEEKGRILRGLYLWQPLVLTNEELSFECAHPDSSRTEPLPSSTYPAELARIYVHGAPPPPAFLYGHYGDR
eukprot:evm.model.NODE_11327_length_113420_cov_67.305626.19